MTYNLGWREYKILNEHEQPNYYTSNVILANFKLYFEYQVNIAICFFILNKNF